MLSFYFDEHMPRAVEKALKDQSIEVIMAVDIDMTGKDDDTEHLPKAAAYRAVLVTRDAPFAGRTMSRTDHDGLICWTGAPDDFGGMITTLALFAEMYSVEEVKGQVFWLK